MILALPVRTPNDFDRILLRIGYTLNQATIERLDALGIRSVWVRCPSLEVLCKFFNEDIHRAQATIMRQIAGAFDSLQSQVNGKLPYHSYRKTIRDLIGHLVSNPRAAIFLSQMNDTNGSGMIAHSARVTFLSLLMGLKLEGYLVRQRKRINPAIAKEVTALGLGALLHDVGVIQLPGESQMHYLATGDDRDTMWREHPRLGYQTVRGRIEPSAATIVLNHHQRYDGSGYAGEGVAVLNGEGIHVFARIVGLAEQFDRMLNPPNLPPRSALEVIRQLLSCEELSRFDPHVMRALLSVVPPYPPGSAVRLSDGRAGICIDHVPVDPCRPIVQIVPDLDRIDPNGTLPGEAVELYEHDATLFITECDGKDVSELNFPQPSFMKDVSQGVILKRKGGIGLM